MELNKKLLEEIGFKYNEEQWKDICPYYMELGGDIVLELSYYPNNVLTLNMQFRNGLTIVTNAKTLDDIIIIGKMFKDCIIDEPV